jgi:hypothetical protein
MKTLAGLGAAAVLAASPSPDPPNPDTSIFPPSPVWLFPTVMALFAVSLSVAAILLIRWNRARRKSADLMQKEREDARD